MFTRRLNSSWPLTGWYSPEAEFISVWGTAGLADVGTFSWESMAFRGSCHVVV
ncbi:rCG31658 [Rattus norvegicus]|uniref:RCG31658 n=1 Tax=Rattus norvegicus TaxID=10116 RepID=A6JN49_RAT|nr:rCG31658 [Rattus norvegicus]